MSNNIPNKSLGKKILVGIGASLADHVLPIIVTGLLIAVFLFLFAR